MTMQNITDFLDKKITENENEIIITFYELRVKMNLSEEETNIFLDYCKTRLENIGYHIYFKDTEFFYNDIIREVKDNELMIAIKQ